MKFGVREICDVVLRAKSTQKVGNKIFFKDEPVCYFDTLKTSTFEGAATTVYAQGGRGNARLMSWDGERTVTFTMEDALISPIGLSILSGAGLLDASAETPVIGHVTEIVSVTEHDSNYGLPIIQVEKKPHFTSTSPSVYVMGLNSHGEVVTEPFLYSDGGYDENTGKYRLISESTVWGSQYYTSIPNEDSKSISILDVETVLVDYYTKYTTAAMQIDITPDKFGGTYYLEASTLWRDQGSGKDYPAEFIIPSCRVQSNFSFSMSSSGDPSTFTFTMDAFPDYTRWDKTKKVLASIQVLGTTLEENEKLREQTWTGQTEEDVIVYGINNIETDVGLNLKHQSSRVNYTVPNAEARAENENWANSIMNISWWIKAPEGVESYQLYYKYTSADLNNASGLLAYNNYDGGLLTATEVSAGSNDQTVISLTGLNPHRGYILNLQGLNRAGDKASEILTLTIPAPLGVYTKNYDGTKVNNNYKIVLAEETFTEETTLTASYKYTTPTVDGTPTDTIQMIARIIPTKYAGESGVAATSLPEWHTTIGNISSVKFKIYDKILRRWVTINTKDYGDILDTLVIKTGTNIAGVSGVSFTFRAGTSNAAWSSTNSNIGFDRVGGFGVEWSNDLYKYTCETGTSWTKPAAAQTNYISMGKVTETKL